MAGIKKEREKHLMTILVTYMCNVRSPEKIGTHKIMGLHLCPVEKNQSIRTKIMYEAKLGW